MIGNTGISGSTNGRAVDGIGMPTVPLVNCVKFFDLDLKVMYWDGDGTT